MSVSALLVLGERGAALVEHSTMQQWFHSYIGMSITDPTHTC